MFDLTWLFGKAEPEKNPNCVILSILCGWTWGMHTGHEVRIAVYRISKHEDHSQAEALIGDNWIPLTEQWTGKNLKVVTYVKHYPGLEPYRYLTLQDWIDEQFRYARQP